MKSSRFQGTAAAAAFCLALVGVLVAHGSAAPAGATEAPAKAAATPDWSCEGIMTEACQCNVVCPCTFLDKPSMGHCDDTMLIQLTKGHYGEVPLDGQSIVVVSASKEGQRLVDTVGDLVFANIYVSEASSPAQRE